MFDILGKHWWIVLVRGILAIVFGIVAIVWPGVTLFVLVTLFSAYASVNGIFSIVGAVRAAERHVQWLALLAEGILGIIIGVITFFHPALTAIAFLYFIAAWTIITGILELFAAIRLRQGLSGEVLLVLAGIASVILGVLLAIFPRTGRLHRRFDHRYLRADLRRAGDRPLVPSALLARARRRERDLTAHATEPGGACKRSLSTRGIERPDYTSRIDQHRCTAATAQTA